MEASRTLGGSEAEVGVKGPACQIGASNLEPYSQGLQGSVA